MNKSKRKENLINEKDIAFLSKKLAQINTEAPIEISANELEYPGKDVEKLITLYKEIDYNSHIEKLDTKENMESPREQPKEQANQFEVVDEMTADMFADEMDLYLEMLDEN